jgi:hypothetical protein
LNSFQGFHSEWNLGSPGGWDYQRVTQIIGKAVWQKMQLTMALPIELDFDHPLLYPIHGFVDMLIQTHRMRNGADDGLIAVVAEEETLEEVTENRNLAEQLDRVDGLNGALMAPQELERHNGRVCYQGKPVSLMFMDFNTDVLLKLHRRHDLAPVLQAVRENRVINPRGTEPINVKSMFEVLTGTQNQQFHREIVARTPWTRRFLERRTQGPQGQAIEDLIEWTRRNWDDLVLKPERGYSGHGVRVGGINSNATDAIELALTQGDYIVQAKVPLPIWSEEIPVLKDGQIGCETVQTDFRCLLGPNGMFGFLGRYGSVPTNVGSGGGVQPLAVVHDNIAISDAVGRINRAICGLEVERLEEISALQAQMALDQRFTYLLGPIKIALRPRLIAHRQLAALQSYGQKLWSDCLTMEKMWQQGELDDYIDLEDEELEIARWQPWQGGPAIIASDGLFGFGAQVESAS